MPFAFCTSESKPRRFAHGAFVAVGAERDVNDARPQPRDLFRAEAIALHGTRPIALHKNVGVTREAAKRLAPRRLAEIDEGRELAAPIVHHQRHHLW